MAAIVSWCRRKTKKYPVSEWWQMGGLVFLTKRLIEKCSKESH
jgi:hypothetical protein